ncbi:MAG: PocR ligand-binding domain-containing protein [Eubacteriales bacterium]
MLKNLSNGEIDIASLEIEDVIDIHTMSKFLDNFAISMGMGCGAVNTNGNMIDNGHYFASFCMDYTRSTGTGCRRCDDCSKTGGETATRTGKKYVYKCHAGLIDFAVPILVEGHQIGSVIGGQILTSPPDEAQFRQTAHEIGVDEDAYIKAVNQVTVTSPEKIDAAAELLYIVTNSLSNQGYEQLKLKVMLQVLMENFNTISVKMQELGASSINVSDNQVVLNEEINGVKNISAEINAILHSIERIANETKMLGINASIEAARAGEVGRGFGVVATEIRHLSDNSRDTAQKIAELTAKIQKSVDRTIESSTATLENARQQTAAIEEVNTSLHHLTVVANELNKHFLL